MTVGATDQNGVQYDLPLAVGDRLRLFARTPASSGGKGGNLAFDRGNLLNVARTIRARDSTRPIIVAADKDHH